MGGEVINDGSVRSEGKFIFFIRRFGKYHVSISHQQSRAADAQAKRFLEETLFLGAARLRSWLPGAGADTLIFSSGWFFDLAGTVNSCVGAPQMLCLNRVSPAIHFPGTYTVLPHKTTLTTRTRSDLGAPHYSLPKSRTPF